MDTVQLRTYELTYLIPGSLTDNEAAQVRTEIEQLLKKHKAVVKSSDDWGRKPLAYTMTHEGKKQHDALYVHVVFDLVPSQAPILEKDVYLVNKVMRHLLLVADDTVIVPTEDQPAA